VTRHLLVIAGLAAAALACTVLPFLPGRYDPVAMPLSIAVRFTAMAALVLVPGGLMWWGGRFSRPLAVKSRSLALASLAVSSVVWLLASIALLTASAVLGVLVAGAGVVVLWRAVQRWRQDVSWPMRTSLGLYVVLVPPIVVALQWTIVPRAVEFSRDRAIRRSAPLIAAIERYRQANGRYPLSLMALWPDYAPGVIGIERYAYEPSGEAYNLCFEQPALPFGTREIVMYNPRGEQEMTSHAMDLLDRSPAQLNRMRGYHAVRDAAHPHWKSFWFD
jgi:hypothetical protein